MGKIILSIALVFSLHSAFGQEWVDMMNQPGKNFYEIQAAFNDYWKDKDISVPGNGYKPFKRWEYFMEPRVYPSGDLSLVSNTLKNYQEFLEENSNLKSLNSTNSNSQLISSTTWTAMGPMGPMNGVATNGFPRKAGRDNFITFHPSIPSTFWAGAPAGGLWKTTNAGTSWTTNTDYLPVIGCSDLAIDPLNPNIMYLATGDGDAGDTYCIGVLKSTDGGITWNSSGLTFAVSLQRQMRRLIINPANPQILLAATNAGIFRTSNAGASWSTVLSGDFFDLEFKPGDPNTVYVGGTSFRLSTDAGLTFTTISNGIPTSGANRIAIAVTPDDPNYVYVLRSSSSTSGFAGLYRSVTSGVSFTTMSTAPDVLANSCSGTAGGGQGWYDLCIAASPTNKNQVVVGGVNVWSSNTGGATGTWTCIGCWIGTSAPAVYLKADHHDLEYSTTGILYAATDGGIFSYNTSNWIDLNNQRNIAQIYKIGLSSLSANKWITGHQDNGTGIYNGLTYQASYPGDGMDCFIDRTNDMNVFASTPGGSFVRSTNGGNSYSSATSGLTGTGAWVSPWKQDPSNANLLYAARSQLFVSTNLGASWTQLTATGASGQITEFAIAPSNNQVIYVLQGTSIRKTTDAGLTWTAAAGVTGGSPTFITIDPTDANTAWVTVSGYSAGNKVFQTTNGGTSWINISANLPNLPANCSVYEPGSNDRIYVGMDVGVYYKDNSSPNWTLYNIGLPNTPISDMEISPAAPGILRAATYGRGVYQVDLVPTSSTPTSSFSVVNNLCTGVPLVFLDASNNSPNAWSWSVSPSAGVSINTSSSQNPTLNFSNGGNYIVSLIASNVIGAGNIFSQTISINNTAVLNISNPSPTICVGEEITLIANGAASYTWLPGGSIGANVSYTPSSNSVYTCNATDINGCKTSALVPLTLDECVSLNGLKNSLGFFSVYPNPANDKINIRSGQYVEAKIVLTDIGGKIIFESSTHFKKEKNEFTLSITALPKGVYFIKISPMEGQSQVIRILKE